MPELLKSIEKMKSILLWKRPLFRYNDYQPKLDKPAESITAAPQEEQKVILQNVKLTVFYQPKQKHDFLFVDMSMYAYLYEIF